MAHVRGRCGSARTELLSGSPASLSEAELVAVLLGEACVGSRTGSLLDSLSGGLLEIRADDLTAVAGVGPVAAARVLAGVELSRRAGTLVSPERPTISTPGDVMRICAPRMAGLDREHFWGLALNTKNRLLKAFEVSVGSLSASIVHPRELFKDAVRLSAASLVVVHNHPSGDPTPSGADIQLTRRLVKAGDVLGIEVLDHVVIGDAVAHTSMRDAGLM